MGKDSKNRSKTTTASSARAVEHLQSSGLGIQFLNLGNDPSSLEFPSLNENTTDEFGDLDNEFRLAFRKFNKRESNTREKGLKSLSELIKNADANSPMVINGVRHFVKFYNYLVFDSVPSIRLASNEVLCQAILKLRKQIAEHVVKMLPSTLISLYDSHSSVRRFVKEDLLEKCFDEAQRKNIYGRTSKKSIEICLQIIKKKSSLVTKQKYEDMETLQQRADRIIIQAFTAFSGLISQCPDNVEEVLSTFDNVFDSFAKNTQILNSLLTCLLQILKDGHLGVFIQLDMSFKILKLLDSNIDVLSKNAFGIYLFMAEGIGSKKIESQFTKNQFVDELVLRMCTNKGRHFNALQESLLPLMIIAIKYEEDGNSFEWIAEVMESFFEGTITDDIYLAWAKTYVDVSDWLYKSFLPNNQNENFAKRLGSTAVKFVQSYVEREGSLASDIQPTFLKLFGDFVVFHLTSSSDELANKLVELLVDDLPLTSSLMGYVLSTSKDPPNKNFIDSLVAKTLISDKTPGLLFNQLVQQKSYINNSQLDLELFAEKLVYALKNGDLSDYYLECYKYLQEHDACSQYNLSEIVDFNLSENLSRVLRVFDTKNFSSDDRLSFLRSYAMSFTDKSVLENPWSDKFLTWSQELDTDTVYSLIVDLYDRLNLRLFVKLVLTLNSSKLNFNDQQQKEIANLILKRIFKIHEIFDRSDADDLNAFLEGNAVDVKPFANELFERLDETKLCDFSKWFTVGSSLQLPYIANSFETSVEKFHELTQFLDASFGEEILQNETMLVAAALSSNNYQAVDVDRRNVLIKFANTSSFYLGLKSQNTSIQMYVCLCYTILKLYANGLIIQNELCRNLSTFMQYWDEIVKTWNMSNVCERIVTHLIDSKKEIPFTVLFMLRQLKSEFVIENLPDAFAVSTLDNKQKLRAIASLSFNLPHELLTENDYLHFVNSLEKVSEKIRNRDKDQIDIALITLGDLRSKVETDNFDGLFCVEDDDPIKSALSCAVLRVCTLIYEVLPEIDSVIRDFVLCGLITAAENVSSNFRSKGPIRLLATFASKFFVLYDAGLNKLLSILNSPSAQVLERRTKIEGIQHEWQEFFGSSFASYLMTWFCSISFTESNETERFPEFFRVQICKLLHNADSKLGLFKFVQNAVPSLFAQLEIGSDVETRDIFGMLVELLFSEHPELQLTSIQILQSELINILDSKSDELDENTQVILALRDQDEEPTVSNEHKNIEYKLFEFFTSLLDRVQHTEWTNLNSIDPWLAVADLLLRIVRLLDSQTAAAFCSNLTGNSIHEMLYRICSYVNFNDDSALVKKFAILDPPKFFTLWSSGFDLRKQDALVERLISIEGYSCWLYRRALETLPSVVREWFIKVKNDNLKSYTQRNISPILIENEMQSIGSVQTSDGFTIRARPNTKEIYVKYKIDEAALELTLQLPDDFPLSPANIQHDKRPDILINNLTNTLHKNLFAFINNRNGSLLEGINQWKRGVEKQVEGVEPCSICLMTVSSSEYKLPQLKCRQCKNKFHNDCMLRWIRSSAKPNCPLCRAEFD